MHAATSMTFLFIGILSASQGKAKTEEVDQLEGAWKLVAIETGGIDLFENKMMDRNENYTFRFENCKVFSKKRCDKEMEVSSYSLPKSEKDKPKPIDFKPKDAENCNRPLKGIYIIEKDELKVAISVERLGFNVAPRDEKGRPGSERPKSFDSTQMPAKDENVILLKMKRIK